MSDLILYVTEKALFGLFRLLDFLLKFIKLLRFKINKKLRSKFNQNEIQEYLNDILSSEYSLIEKAKKYRENPDILESEKEIFYYYFLVKHIIAEYESHFGRIPLQIFNEHRMAFDHFMRAKISDTEKNTARIVTHLRRALIDIIKIYCAAIGDEIKKIQSNIPKNVIGLISEGNYIKEYINKKNIAESLLIEARCDEYNVDSPEVVNNFIHALIVHRDWYKFQIENIGKISEIKTRYNIITKIPLFVVLIIVIGLIYSEQIMVFFINLFK